MTNATPVNKAQAPAPRRSDPFFFGGLPAYMRRHYVERQLAPLLTSVLCETRDERPTIFVTYPDRDEAHFLREEVWTQQHDGRWVKDDHVAKLVI